MYYYVKLYWHTFDPGLPIHLDNYKNVEKFTYPRPRSTFVTWLPAHTIAINFKNLQQEAHIKWEI
jgi:hypothetical protein